MRLLPTTALGILLAVIVSVLCWLGIVLMQHQSPTQTAAAGTIAVSPAFAHYYRHHVGIAAACKNPVSRATFHHGVADQHFEHCALIAIYSVAPFPIPTTPPLPSPLPTTAPTARPAPTPVPLPTSAPSPTAIPSDDPALYLLGLINAERQSHGIAPLTLNTTQSACSLAHSVHMAAEGFISHDQFPQDICVPWSAIAENVGESPGPERTAILADFQQMIAEPYAPGCSGNHHCSIDSTVYRQIGIGIYQSGGLTWVTEDFTN